MVTRKDIVAVSALLGCLLGAPGLFAQAERSDQEPEAELKARLLAVRQKASFSCSSAAEQTGAAIGCAAIGTMR